jgi:DNA-binding protein H-NS
VRENAAVKTIDLQSITTDELWTLREEIISLLSAKMHAEKLKLEKRINDLRRKFGEAKASDQVRQPRPYPKVYPKYQNPELPDQTWSGRGKQPHWIRRLLASGKTMDDCRILPDSRMHRGSRINPRHTRASAHRGEPAAVVTEHTPA